MKKRQGFIFGAIVLSASGFLVKLIGAIFKIPLTNLVGTAAMGYFSSAYSVYMVLLSLATSGLPTGIAVMVSSSLALGKNRDIKKVLKISASIFITLGTILTVLGIIFSRQIAIIMNSEEAYYAVVCLMPAVLCISVVALFKGFFQGYNNMVPTAISNLIEAAVKLLAGYSIALYMFNKGYPLEQVVGGAIAGITLSTFCAMMFMWLRYVFRGKDYRIKTPKTSRSETPTPILLKTFLITTFPIIVSSITSNLMAAIDSFSVMDRLKLFNTVDQANLMWGAYGTMALTIFNLPSFLIISIGIALIPNISAAYARNDKKALKDTINKAMKYTSILSFACAFGINACSGMLLNIFFSDQAGIAIATPLLQLMSFILISVGITNIASSILESVKKAYLAVVSVAVGATIKTVLTFILCGIPALGVYGAPIATNIAYPIMVIINLWFIKKYVGIIPNFVDILIKPLIAGIGCFATVKVLAVVFGFISHSKLMLFPIALITAVVYFFILRLLKLITKDDMNEFKNRKKRKHDNV